MRAAWWWIDRWRKSTAYICMSLEEQGLYRNLLDAVWLFDGRPIPDDLKALISASGGDAAAWERAGAKVLQWMRRVEGGWTNDTALAVMTETRALSAKRAEAGLKGMASRWGKNNKPDNKPHNKPDNKHDNKIIAPSPSPSLDLDHLKGTAGVQGEKRNGQAAARRNGALKPDWLRELWNASTAHPLMPVKSLTPNRRQHITARLKEHTADEWRAIFQRMATSPFCLGKGDRGWVASFDWIIRSPDNAVKVLEGHYDPPTSKPNGSYVPSSAEPWDCPHTPRCPHRAACAVVSARPEKTP